MLRNKLLATTFLIFLGSSSFSAAHDAGPLGGPSGAIANTARTENSPTIAFRFSSPGKDRNRLFLCTYGYKVYTSDYDSGSGSGFEHWVHYAVPIRGKGASVSEIQVTDSEASGISPDFIVGIYADKGGRPGKIIAGGKAKAKGSCRLTSVIIPKTFLTAGTKYWVVENAPDRDDGKGNCCGYYAVNWGYRQTARHNAYYQYFESVSQASSSLSDWLPVSGPAPFVRVK